MDINKTITLEEYENDTETGIHFKTILEKTRQVNNEDFEYNESAIKDLAGLNKAYTLGEKFAEGGQGEILTGTHKLLKRFVAIKSLKKEFTNKPEIVNNFISEAIVTAQLDHPGIIPLYGITKDDENGLHISMKLVHGQTLEELIKNDKAKCANVKVEKQALIRRLEYFTSICDAMSYAHDKKIIHRDLKPENIMVGSFNEVYVMDWGISEVYAENKESVPSISGTPGYIAPEVLIKENPCPKSDQYSLGIILYELVCLKTALTANTVNSRLLDTLNGERPPMEHFSPKIKIHPDLKAICTKACALCPEDRYASITELANDVRQFIKKEEVLARPDNSIRKMYRLIAAYRHQTAAVILLTLLILAGLAINSLNEQNRIVQESKKRELKLLNLRSSTEHRSHQIDSHFSLLAGLLERYADRALFLLESDFQFSDTLFKDYTLFKTSETGQPGSAFSDLYKQVINPSFGNYKIASGSVISGLNDKLNKASPLVDYSLQLMSESTFKKDRQSEGMKSKLFSQGYPVCWMYFGMEEGIIFNYPANGILSEDYDHRKRPWYKDTIGKSGVIWSEPYEDLFGMGTVISATKAVYSKNNKFLGIAAFDLTLGYTRKIMTEGEVNPALIANLLIDSKGKILISSQNSELMNSLDLSKHLQSGKAGQFELNHNSKKIIVDFAPISTLNWYYIELIDIEKYLNL